LRRELFDAEPVDAAASVVAATFGLVVARFLAVHLRGQPEHQRGLEPVEWRQRVSVPTTAEERRQRRRRLIEWQHFQHRLIERQRVRRRHRERRNFRPAVSRRTAAWHHRHRG
jgi:hypothetical protein